MKKWQQKLPALVSILAIIISTLAVIQTQKSDEQKMRLEMKLENKKELFAKNEYRFEMLNNTLSRLIKSISKLYSDNVKLMFITKSFIDENRENIINKINSSRWIEIQNIIAGGGQLLQQQESYLTNPKVSILIKSLHSLISWNTHLYWNSLQGKYTFNSLYTEPVHEKFCEFKTVSKKTLYLRSKCIRQQIVASLNVYKNNIH